MSGEATYVSDVNTELMNMMFLNLEERGAYFTLLNLFSRNNGKLINEPSRLARTCGCSTRKFNSVFASLLDKEVVSVSNGFIKISGGQR